MSAIEKASPRASIVVVLVVVLVVVPCEGTLPIEGVQFHPESIRSEHGHAMIRNFLRRCTNQGAEG